MNHKVVREHKMAFVKNEDGAISVEWVVGFSAVATLGLAVVMSISNGTETVTGKINDAFMPLAMDLMNLTPAPTYTALVGSSAYNTTQGGQVYSQVQCQHYSMSNDEVWKNCTETLASNNTQTTFWLDGNGDTVDAPNPT